MATKSNKLEAITREQFLDVRLYLRLSQQQTANLLGVSRKTVSVWENGTRKFPRSIGLAMRYLEKFYPPIEKPVLRIPRKRRSGTIETQKVKQPKIVRFHDRKSG